jgi:hypothetical protein
MLPQRWLRYARTLKLARSCGDPKIRQPERVGRNEVREASSILISAAASAFATISSSNFRYGWRYPGKYYKCGVGGSITGERRNGRWTRVSKAWNCTAQTDTSSTSFSITSASFSSYRHIFRWKLANWKAAVFGAREKIDFFNKTG